MELVQLCFTKMNGQRKCEYLVLFNKEHDDVSNVYCIPKLHTNQYVAYNTTNASTFSRSQVIHLIIEYSV
jgi:hypothetical protein